MKDWINYNNDDIILLTKAMLDKINSELSRCYWNKNQKQLVSPFDNTGESYKNNYMSVSAYNWNEKDEDLKPNFETENMLVYWYKHSNRGVIVYFKNNIEDPYKVIANTLLHCVNSIREDFGEL